MLARGETLLEKLKMYLESTMFNYHYLMPNVTGTPIPFIRSRPSARDNYANRYQCGVKA